MTSYLKAINTGLNFAPYFCNLALNYASASHGMTKTGGEFRETTFGDINFSNTKTKIAAVGLAFFAYFGQHGMVLWHTSNDPLTQLEGIVFQAGAALGCYFCGKIMGREIAFNHEIEKMKDLAFIKEISADLIIHSIPRKNAPINMRKIEVQ